MLALFLGWLILPDGRRSDRAKVLFFRVLAMDHLATSLYNLFCQSVDPALLGPRKGLACAIKKPHRGGAGLLGVFG
jgi:hypothetical protein